MEQPPCSDVTVRSRHYIDAAEEPYVVVPRLTGVSKGDYGLVIRNKTGRALTFIFGDSANKEGSIKLGKCSGYIFKVLGESHFNEEPKARTTRITWRPLQWQSITNAKKTRGQGQ
jgi:hypothetical protein